jgi:plastocyanin
MKRRLTVAVAATAAVGLGAAGLAATASAAIPKNEIRMVGGTQVKPGKYIKVNFRFKHYNTPVKSGATVKLVNKIKDPEPHSISFVEKKFLPGKTLESPVLPLLGKAHGVPEDNPDGEPTIPVVDNGVAVPEGGTLGVDTGFTDTVMGDSAFIPPDLKTFGFQVTADRGSKLFYFCAIHPWMQGKITVK